MLKHPQYCRIEGRHCYCWPRCEPSAAPQVPEAGFSPLPPFPVKGPAVAAIRCGIDDTDWFEEKCEEFRQLGEGNF